jgi:carboxyl-terminal processing protease
MKRFNSVKVLASIIVFLILGVGASVVVWPKVFRSDEMLASSQASQSAKSGAGYLSCSDIRDRVETFLKHHYSYHAFDEELSRRVFGKFFHLIDSGKNFLLESDVEALRSYETQFPSAVKKADCRFMEQAYSTYLKRVRESMGLIDAALKKPFDFNVEETIEIDRKKLPWAKNSAELQERWRKLLKFSALGMTEADPTLKFEEVGKKLKKRYELLRRSVEEKTPDEVNGIFMNAFALSLDPHSQYMLPADQEDFNVAFSLQLVGIGASLSQQDGYTVVEAVIPGGAAARDGRLKKGDKIVSVDSGDGQSFVDVIDMDLSKVVSLIRGKKSTRVKLVILRKNESGEVERFVLDLLRDVVHLADSEAHSDVMNIDNKKIGVINLPTFYRDYQASRGDGDAKSSAGDIAREIKRLTAQKVDGILLDLRSNGGGDLSECIRMTGLFIDKGPVVQVAPKDSDADVLEDKDKGALYTGPFAVLISKHSASASEILSGAIQDYGRGLVLGNTRTYGKGTVQNVLEIPGSKGRESDGAIKVTVQKFFRPSGKSNQEKGVLSDVVIPSIIETSDASESENDYVLPYSTIPPARSFKPLQDLTPILETLRKKSNERVQKSPAFKDILEIVAKKEKDQTVLSLKREKKDKAKPTPTPSPAPGKVEEIENKVIRENDAELKEAGQVLVDSIGLLGGKTDWTK